MMDNFENLISNKDDNAIALQDYNEKITYGELKEKVYSLSNLLKEKSNLKHYRVLFSEKPSILLSLAYLSVVCSGGVAFFLPPNSENICDFIDEYEIDLVVTEQKLTNDYIVPLADFICLNFVFKKKRKRINVFDACTAFFTSGTLGKSKCVLLSQKNLCENVRAGASMIQYSSEDVHLNILPYHHAYGITCSLLTTLYSGGTLCFGESVATFFKDLKIFNPTFIQTVPMILQSLIAYAKNNEIKLNKILSGGAHTPPEIIQGFREIGVSVYSCYGMTECSPGIACNDGNINKDLSVGKLLQCNKVKFIDDEICLLGTNVMVGYFGCGRHKGWFATGDCGYIDSDGYLYLTGRKNGSIKLSNGEKLFPEQVEDVANKYAGIIESKATLKESGVFLEIYTGANTIDVMQLNDYLVKMLPFSVKIKKIVVVPNEFSKTSIMKIRRV